jgi:hypothetical protein
LLDFLSLPSLITDTTDIALYIKGTVEGGAEYVMATETDMGFGLTPELQFRCLLLDSGDTSTSGFWIDVAETDWYNSGSPTLEIANAKELAGIAKLVNLEHVNFSGKTITIASDIDLAGRVWTPIENFSGILEGNQHSISNMKVTNGKGLFVAIVNKGLVSNLNLVNVDVNGTSNVGGLAGAIDDATVQLCTVSGNVRGASGVGMIVGGNYGTVFQCTAQSGAVTGTGSFTGGVVGSNYGKIVNSKSYVTVKGGSSVGGITGENYAGSGNVENNEAYSPVSGSSAVGGVIGRHYAQSAVSGNKFSQSGTGQTWGIGFDYRKSPVGPSNDGATPQ